MNEVVELQRSCPVVLIPSGRAGVLARGERVAIVQQLGGSFTVEVGHGLLARVDGADADALGMEIVAKQQPAGSGPLDADDVLERLRAVFDPEIPVNVVDLGLIYSCDVSQALSGGYRVAVTMSMTAPGCGMGDVLRDEAVQKILELPGVLEAAVELVWEPPWDLSRMSEAARLQLGMW
ncbi:MAG: iron-sulfur cluster assembly protein [Actinomycetota bacterium]|nr:iron-sulfur cluster assembly protein [Actinomycetota bacterium]MDA8039531.1 iron-sulfur cluster assembly protein [Actinomycetota bacterium]